MASALIFLALAVAWAAYLIPQAVRHRHETQHQRSVQKFSDRMRVLARREPTSSKDARLVVTPPRAPSRPALASRASARPTAVAAPARPVPASVRRAAAQRAARRRRNVLAVIASLIVVVAGLALGGLFSAWWIAAPGALMVAWLVACRLSVKRERGVSRPAAVVVDDETVAIAPVAVEIDEETGEIIAVVDDPSRWDMVPVTLPTYVTKPAATSSVSTIDLDSTGVWTSGHTESDSEIARQAEARRRSASRIAEARQAQRAVGS